MPRPSARTLKSHVTLYTSDALELQTTTYLNYTLPITPQRSSYQVRKRSHLFNRGIRTLNSWFKTHELVTEGTTISHFELDSRGNLILVPQTPILKELAVAEIIWQF